MHIAVRARRVLARHPSIYWICCCSLAIAAGLLVRQQLVEVDEARLDWGATREVFVASADIDPGEPLAVRRVSMPLAVVPTGAIDAGDGLAAEAAATIARQRVGVGEVVVEADVTSMPGPAALAAPGSMVVGITDPLARGVVIGLQVAVASGGIMLARVATVVGVADDVILVAVDEGDAAIVAAAAHDGTASVLFKP